MTCQTPIVENLRSHGVRITPQREIILETLCHSPGHMTAEEIFAQIEGRLPGVNIATVYRTLEMLRRSGVVSMIHDASGRSEFEVVHAGKNHAHLVCERCGALVEIDHSPLVQLRHDVEQAQGFTLKIEHLSLTGLCAECRRRSPAP